MRYQLIQLFQLAFALGLIFSAFLGGLWLGWWRWGKPAARREAQRRARSEATAPTQPDLFTPADMGSEEVVLSPPVFGPDSAIGRRSLPAPADPGG